MAHARRKFFEAQAEGEDALWGLAQVQQLYRIEERLRQVRAGPGRAGRNSSNAVNRKRDPPQRDRQEELVVHRRPGCRAPHRRVLHADCQLPTRGHQRSGLTHRPVHPSAHRNEPHRATHPQSLGCTTTRPSADGGRRRNRHGCRRGLKPGPNQSSLVHAVRIR